MMIGWEGNLVHLVPLEKEKHLLNCVKWLNDPDVNQWIERGDFPINTHVEEEFFNRHTTFDPKPRFVHFAIETLEGKHIGVGGFEEIHWRHGFGYIYCTIGDKSCWRKGCGSEAVLLFTEYGFNVLGLRMVLGKVFADNAPSRGMLKKLGYKECAHFPKYIWRRGSYRDFLIFCCQKEEWMNPSNKLAEAMDGSAGKFCS